jgi:hypothetical protein
VSEQECGADVVATGVRVKCHLVRDHKGPHKNSTYGTRWTETRGVLPPQTSTTPRSDLRDGRLQSLARSRRTARTTGRVAVSAA